MRIITLAVILLSLLVIRTTEVIAGKNDEVVITKDVNGEQIITIQGNPSLTQKIEKKDKEIVPAAKKYKEMTHRQRAYVKFLEVVEWYRVQKGQVEIS